MGPIIASIIGALSYELIFSFPLKPVIFEDKIEMDAAPSPPPTPVKEVAPQDIVISNKSNGDIAYE